MPKKPKKISPRKLLSRMLKKADKALSLYVREETRLVYSVCPLCQVNPIECCFHFVTRKRAFLRWDIRNVIGACNSCNWQENYWPDLSRAWYIRTYGVERYLQLVEESKRPLKPDINYLEAVIQTFTRNLEVLKNGKARAQTPTPSDGMEPRPQSEERPGDTAA